MEKLAIKSKHLTAKLLEQQLKNIENKNLQIYLYHLKYNHYKNITKEVSQIQIFKNKVNILQDNLLINLYNYLFEHKAYINGIYCNITII